MATIKPFKGIRPPQDLVEQVASRPYDVLNSEEARAEAAGNDKSLYHIIKPEIDFPVGTDEHDEKVYAKAAENFRLFRDKGWLVQDDKENYYIYAQTMNGKTQYGLVVGAYVPDYMNGVIKKHELTRRDKEEDRMKHVRVNNANIEPVFFAYPDNAVLDAIIRKYTAQKPVYDFIAPGDGFGHTFWVIDNSEDIAVITKEFAAMPALYIADGHHRSAAAALVGAEKAKQNPNHRGDEEYNYFMAVCFPANQLTIIDYNRVVKDLNGLTPAEFLTALGKNFEIEEKGKEIYKPNALHNFALYLDGKWYIYFAAGEAEDVWRIRPYVLECDGDPMTGEWSELGPMKGCDDDPFSFTDFSLDATIFEHKGDYYYVWAQKASNISNLYIAKMAAPNKLATVMEMITTPDYDWERILFWVNEGPAVLKHDGKIWLTFSASGTGSCYCVGLLSADENADLLDPASWTKERMPVLKTDQKKGLYGPGHNSFTTDEDGNDIMVYHARTYDGIKTKDPLYDPNRHAHLLKVQYDENGRPIFDYQKH